MTRRQLSDQDKQKLIEKHIKDDKDGVLRCFIDGHPVEDLSQVEFHHIIPYSEGGPSDHDNIAPVCKDHHRRIRTLSLQEFRDKLNFDCFFEDSCKKADGVRLNDVLAFILGKNISSNICQWEVTDDLIKLYWERGSESFRLYKCPVTAFTYFYALVPIEYLKNDAELQPRPLESGRMWELYRHFLRYTQLAPAVCRMVGDQILLFDGQHKTAAQIWAGRRQVECKRKNPLTIYALQRTFFAEFLAQPPMQVEFESSGDYRDREKKNLIRLLNLLVEVTLTGQWNPEARNDAHKTAERIYAAGSIRTWVPMIRAVIAAKLNLIDDDERRKVF